MTINRGLGWLVLLLELNAQSSDSQLVLAFCFIFGVFFVPGILFSALPKDLPVLRIPEGVAEVPALDLDLLLGHEVRILRLLLTLLILVMFRRREGHQPGWRVWSMWMVDRCRDEQVVHVGVELSYWSWLV